MKTLPLHRFHINVKELSLWISLLKKEEYFWPQISLGFIGNQILADCNLLESKG
jgi:hypothetical protein